LYLTIIVGWRKRWGKFAVRISRLNTRVPGGSGVDERSSEDHVYFEDRWMVDSLCDE
jgi:hypothetical protein